MARPQPIAPTGCSARGTVPFRGRVVRLRHSARRAPAALPRERDQGSGRTFELATGLAPELALRAMRVGIRVAVGRFSVGVVSHRVLRLTVLALECLAELRLDVFAALVAHGTEHGLGRREGQGTRRTRGGLEPVEGSSALNHAEQRHVLGDSTANVAEGRRCGLSEEIDDLVRDDLTRQQVGDAGWVRGHGVG